MNVETGTEAVQFPEKEHINGIFFAVLWPFNQLTKILSYPRSLVFLLLSDFGSFSSGFSLSWECAMAALAYKWSCVLLLILQSMKESMETGLEWKA